MLYVNQISGERMSDPVQQVLPQQTISQLLTPARFDFGLRRNELIPYNYAAGDLILCRRDGEKWVRWYGAVRMLTLSISDEAFQHVTGDYSGGLPSLDGAGLLEDPTVQALFKVVHTERASGFVSGQIFLDSMAQALAATLVSKYGFSRRRVGRYRGGLAPHQLRRVTAFVHENLDKNLRLLELAEYASLSPAYFCQQFRRSTGLAPHQFILKSRVEKAKNLLAERRNRILDIAILCGFQSQQHFSRVFRKVCGMSPSEYRASLC